MEKASPIAAHVISIVGGTRKVAEITGRTSVTVLRWTYPKDRGGTGGYIPHELHQSIMTYAEENGIPLTHSDFFEPIKKEAP